MISKPSLSSIMTLKKSNANTPYIYNIFGSRTSIDRDVMVIIKSPLATQDAHNLVHELDRVLISEFPKSSKRLNTNICTVSEGNLLWTFKGVPDECQNSILATYAMHEQHHPCIVERTVPRNIPMKITRSLRSILSTMTRTEGNRETVKKALKNDTIRARLDCLNSIDLSTLVYMKSCKENPIEIYKQIAFQMGQTRALLREDSLELFDKILVGYEYPTLYSSLMRKEPTPESLIDLNAFKVLFIKSIENVLKIKAEWEIFAEVVK